MLTRIDLRYFKCFDSLKLPLRPLTLLSGANASGKSSVMQALVLLHQTMREHEWSKRLMLNGSAIRLGTTSDVIDQLRGRRDCTIAVMDGDRTYQWEFEGKRDEMSMEIRQVRVDGIKDEEPKVFYHLLPPTHARRSSGKPSEWPHLSDCRATGAARDLPIERSRPHSCRWPTGRIRRQRSSFRSRHPRAGSPDNSGRTTYPVAAGGGADGAVLSGVCVGN